MVAKNPKKIWNERNIWKSHTKYGEDGMTEIQHTVSSVERLLTHLQERQDVKFGLLMGAAIARKP